MVNGVSKPKPGWLTRVTEEASYGHWVKRRWIKDFEEHVKEEHLHNS